MAVNLICRLLGHGNGKWEYQEQGDSCHAQARCKRCGQVTTNSLAHDWSDTWAYQRAGSCDQVRVCSHCGANKQQVERELHEWSAWQFTDHQCVKTHACARCGKTESKQTEHQWSNWEYIGPRSCEQHRVCQRCGQVEGRTEHIYRVTGYGHRTYNAEMGAREKWRGFVHPVYYRCEHCGAEKSEHETHSWEVYKLIRRDDGSIVARTVKCRFCGATDEEEEVGLI